MAKTVTDQSCRGLSLTYVKFFNTFNVFCQLYVIHFLSILTEITEY